MSRDSCLLAMSKSWNSLAINLDLSSSHRQPWDIDDQDMSKLFTVLCCEEPPAAHWEESIFSRYIAGFRCIILALSHEGGGPGGGKRDVLGHLECLVGLLKSNGNPTLNNFYEAGQCLEGWPKTSTLDKHVSATLYPP